MMHILEGCKVIELAGVLAGPSVGMFLAELGANVIKIENPKAGGDVTRSWKLPTEATNDSRSSYFNSINWGKKCITVDLKSQDGINEINNLISDADIVLTSFKSGDAKKLFLTYEDVKEINPGIIYGSITGFGENDHRTAYDALIQAETGFMHLNREPGGTPMKMPVALMDILAAHHLKQLLLLAWINKLKTGEGCHVEVSLFEAAVSSLANQAGSWLYAGVDPEPAGSEHPHIYPYGGLFSTMDGRYIIPAIGTNTQFENFCRVIGVPDLARDERFSDNQSRSKNRNQLRHLLTNAISKIGDAGKLVELLNKNKVPVGLIRTVREAVETYIQTFPIHEDDGMVGIPGLAGRVNNNRVSKNLRSPEKTIPTSKNN